MTQSNFNIFTVKQKLTRHKLKFDYDEGTETLTVGKAKNMLIELLLWIVVPLIVIIVVIIAINQNVMPRFGTGRGLAKILGILLATPCIFLLAGISKVMKKKNQNLSEKTFAKGYVDIADTEGEKKKILKSQIEKFDYSFFSDDLAVIGTLKLYEKNGKEHDLFGIQESDLKFVKNDMEYFKKYFTQLVLGEVAK